MLDDLASLDPAETWWQRSQRAISAARAHPRRLLTAVLAVVAIAIGLWWLLRPPPALAPEQLLPVVTANPGSPAGSAGGSVTATVPTPSTVVIHIAGAVSRPGVLRLPVGARVVDAIDAAGGAAADADVDRINLAATLSDGAWVHVPRAGEVVPSPPSGSSGGGSGGGSAPGSGSGAAAGTPLDLNAASAEQLDTLPGVGPATASAIVEHRERNGPFRSVDALADVPGIGPAKLERLRPLVRV